MAIQRSQPDFAVLEAKLLADYAGIPAAIAGDCMNRQQIMAGRISPLAAGMAVAGQARTVTVPAGDNSAIHAAIALIKPGEVLVVDAGGYADRAVWGAILHSIARRRGAAGVIIDGAVRDAAELRQMTPPIFASATSPAGPHKGWGGRIDGPVSCGGVVVRPGDLVLGDDDGVAVVPLEDAEAVLTASRQRLDDEARILERLEAGEDSTAIFPLPAMEDRG